MKARAILELVFWAALLLGVGLATYQAYGS